MIFINILNMKANSAIAEVKIVRNVKSSQKLTKQTLITALKLASLIKPAQITKEVD